MSQLVNQGFIGQDFLWWIGQVADDSYWRDNILSGKYKSNIDLKLKASLEFEQEVKKYSFMWKEGGEYSKN